MDYAEFDKSWNTQFNYQNWVPPLVSGEDYCALFQSATTGETILLNPTKLARSYEGDLEGVDPFTGIPRSEIGRAINNKPAGIQIVLG